MSLHAWLSNGRLRRHEPTRAGVAELLAVVERDLASATVEGLSPDWRLAIAYNAALQLATLALEAEGYRPGRERAHERAIASLAFTVELPEATVALLDTIRRKRNLGNYERAGAVSPQEAAEVLALASALRDTVLEWLRRRHAALAP